MFSVILNLINLIGTWPDKAHLTPKNIDELREFVQARLSKELAKLGNPWVIIPAERRTILVSNVRSVNLH